MFELNIRRLWKVGAGLASGLMLAMPLWAETTLLRVASWDTGTSVKTLQQAASLFEAQNPGVKVQIEAYGDDYDQKLGAAIAAHNPPDVVQMWNFPAYAAALEPLDGYLRQDKLPLSDLVPVLLNYNRMGGKLYGLPAGFSSFALYYNKAMFDKAGVAYPTDSWTWDDVRAAARKLRNKGLQQYGFGIDGDPDPYDLQSYLWSNGTTMVSSDGKKITGHFNSPQSREVFEMFADMLKQEEAMLYNAGNVKGYRESFIADKMAMVVSGAWPRAAFIKAGKRFGVVSLPAFKGKSPVSVVSQSALSIPREAHNKALAWRFLKFYITPQAVTLRKDVDLPVSQTVARSANFLTDPYIWPFYKILGNGSHTPAFLQAKGWDKAQPVLLAGIKDILLKRSDVAMTLDRAAQEAEQQLQP